MIFILPFMLLLSSKIMSFSHTMLTLFNQTEDLERRCRQQQDQIFELKEQVTSLQAELKMKGSQFDGNNSWAELSIFFNFLSFLF